ncbi:MAG TPA: heme exporter protein CcmB [Candidatus Binataceae bacterium]
MNGFIAVLRKDLRLELRSGHSTIALVGLSLLVLVVLVFASNPVTLGRESAASALWIATVLAGITGATRAISSEHENGCIRGLLLSPLDPGVLYAAKFASSFIFMIIAEAAGVVIVTLFFNLDFDAAIVRIAPVLIMGAIGFAALSTLLAAVSARTRGGDLLLPLLAIPIFVPALIAAVKASAALLGGAGFTDAASWLRILLAFDVLFVAAGYMLFEYVAREN